MDIIALPKNGKKAYSAAATSLVGPAALRYTENNLLVWHIYKKEETS